MTEIMFNFGLVIIFLTYCLFVHIVVKNARYDIFNKKLNVGLSLLLVCEMLILWLIV
jgi:hypothetical protein